LKRPSVCAALSLCILLCACIAPPATAQLSVYDPANHAQNILQAARALQQVDQQVEQLTHEIDMLEKMARDLETFPMDVSHAIIQERISRIDALLHKAEGIGYEIGEVERRYNEAYWRPVRVFDDGRQVFIQMPADLAMTDAPPLFVLGRKGNAELINYRIRGSYYIVDHLFQAAELRLGTTPQTVVRLRRGKEPAGFAALFGDRK